MAKHIAEINTDKVLYNLARIRAEDQFIEAMMRETFAESIDVDSIEVNIDIRPYDFCYDVNYSIRTIHGEKVYWSLELPEEVIEYEADVIFEPV